MEISGCSIKGSLKEANFVAHYIMPILTKMRSWRKRERLK
jgi:hypothetical protein